MTDIERIDALYEYSGMTWRRLAEKLGIGSPQTFLDIRNGKIKISFRLQQKILTAFPEINREWLLLGTGDMLNDKASDSSYSSGIKDWFPNADSYVRLENWEVPGFPKGCTVLLKRLLNPQEIIPGRLYFFETNNTTLLRYVQSASADLLVLTTSGAGEDSLFRLPLDSVRRIFSVLGRVEVFESDVRSLEQ